MKQYSDSVLQDWDVQLAMDYAAEKGMNLGLERGMSLGLSRGMLQRTKEIIQAGLKKGMSVYLLADITGYPQEKIRKIKNKEIIK